MVDREYLEARLAQLGGRGAALLKLETGGPEGGEVERAEYTVRLGVSREDLPAVAQKVLTGDLVIERTEVWRRTAPGSYDGTVAATVIGAPSRITGTVRLSDVTTDGRPGCEFAFDGSARVSIPLVGGKIETVIAEQVERLVGREHDFTVDRLRGGRR